MTKLYIYNFNGTIHETYEAFDETYRTLKREAIASGEPFSRQVVCGEQIVNQFYSNGIWLDEK